MHARSMPRKLQRKPVNARSLRESAIGTWTPFVNGNEASVAVAGDAAVVAVEISIDVPLGTRDPHLHEDVARRIVTTTAVHRPGGRWIHTFLAHEGSAAQLKEGVVPNQSQSRFPAPDRVPSPHLPVGYATMTNPDLPDAAIIRADPAHHLLEDEVPEEQGGEGIQIVVITEQDLLHL